ncbi:MAG: hypothetical protein AAGH53_06585 [Pseudomonadota bacterium]
MTSLSERFEQAQTALIAALDQQDADAITAASERLAPLVAELRGSNTIYANDENKESFEKLKQLADAAMYRIDILQDQTRRRLEMLNDQRNSTAQTYGRPAMRAAEA